MGIAELFAFFKALPQLVSLMKEVSDTLKQLRIDAIEKEMAQVRADVHETLDKIGNAQTNEERRKLSLELAQRMSK